MITRTTVQASMTTYSGPVPPAAHLAEYDQVLPGAAHRLVTMAETNQAHRHAIEKRVIDGNVEAQARGQWMGFILALSAFVIGGWLLHEGKTATGVWLILGDLVALAAVFVTGKVLQARERGDRRKESEQGLQAPGRRERP